MRKFVITLLMCIFMFSCPVFAMELSTQQEKMSEHILESLQNEPELWIIKSYNLIYASDKSTVKALRKVLWPESDDSAEMVLQYDVYLNPYVRIEKPFEMRFEGETEEILILEIKKILYKHFKDEVGEIVEKEEQKVPNEKFNKQVDKPAYEGLPTL